MIRLHFDRLGKTGRARRNNCILRNWPAHFVKHSKMTSRNIPEKLSIERKKNLQKRQRVEKLLPFYVIRSRIHALRKILIKRRVWTSGEVAINEPL